MTGFIQCDRCGAGAYVEVTRSAREVGPVTGADVRELQARVLGAVPVLQVLWLCGHHFRAHEVALIAAGWKVGHDRRHELVPAQATP